ncbi:MAG: alpha/beta hydrolase [Treponema sp.]|nr:alpha/beta hydrolase [Treponema sp.]
MKNLDFVHRASDGASIFVHRWLPDGEVRGVLAVAHGMAEHGARYERFASAATAEGWAVYLPDHRGHGRTAAGGSLGWFAERDGFRRVVEDLHEVAAAAALEHDGRPLALFGHSMGSIIAEFYAALHGKTLACCALSGVVMPPPPPLLAAARLLAGVGCIVKGSKAAAPLLNTLSFGANNKSFAPARTAFDWLSRDAAEVDAYVADPLCGFVCSDGLYRDLLGAFRELYRPSGLVSRIHPALPVLVMAGAEDPVGGSRGFAGALAERLKAAGLRGVETRIYPGARHEILNETDRERVTSELLAWLGAHLNAKA